MLLNMPTFLISKAGKNLGCEWEPAAYYYAAGSCII